MAKCTTSQVGNRARVCGGNAARVHVSALICETNWPPPGYMDDHPGGTDILRLHAGEDASQDFDDIGHSSNALLLLQSMVVGVLSTGS